jgi:peptide deformylase
MSEELMYKVIEVPNEVLNRPSEPVDLLNYKSIREARNIVREMKKTLKVAQGLGLAGPQVGVSKRIALINYNDAVSVLINPTIEPFNDVTSSSTESCLSIPGKSFNVVRHKSIVVNSYDEEGHHSKKVVSGLLATIIQHEVDHLDGITLIERSEMKL